MVDLSARTESDNHGAGEDLRACREVRGQRESREEDRVKSRVSVAALGGMSKKESDGGRVDRVGYLPPEKKERVNEYYGGQV